MRKSFLREGEKGIPSGYCSSSFVVLYPFKCSSTLASFLTYVQWLSRSCSIQYTVAISVVVSLHSYSPIRQGQSCRSATLSHTALNTHRVGTGKVMILPTGKLLTRVKKDTFTAAVLKVTTATTLEAVKHLKGPLFSF